MFTSKGNHHSILAIPLRVGMALALLFGLLDAAPAAAADETWSPLGEGLNAEVYALAFDNLGSLYAGGNFTTAGGVPANYIAKWDGSGWSALGSGMNGSVSALAFDNAGNLYAGGSFTTAGGAAANRIAKWNGIAWSALGNGVGGTTPEVNALAVDNAGNVYVGGNFTTAGGATANRIAKWDGAAWSTLGEGTGGRIYALAFDAGGNLYAGGSFTTAGGAAANRIAKWDGSAWSTLGSGATNTVRALAINGSGSLYAGGGFASPASRIAKWDGSAWSALGSGVNTDIYALAVSGSGSVYAAGDFTTAGGATASRIALWNGSAWSPLDSGLDDTGRALAVASNGDLIVGGSFTIAGGATANRIAQWGISASAGFGLSPSSVAENLPIGALVGEFTPEDPEPGETFTYSLVSGTGSSDNASFSIAGDELLTAAVFDYETRSSYSIRVRSLSSLGPSSERVFAITVSDVDEPPVITEGDAAAVTMDRNGSPTAFSLTLHASDENAAALAWSISSAAGHGTATASGTGAAKAIGYTPQTDYTGTDSFTVRAADGAGGADTITVNVTIQLPGTSLDPAASAALFCTGEQATITISLTNVTDLYGYQFVAGYDPSQVSAAGSFVNTFFDTAANASIPSGWNAVCASGACKFAASKVEPGAPVSGSGAVAQVVLTGLSAGTFDLSLGQDILSDRDGQALAHGLSSLPLTVCGFASVSGTITLQGRSTPLSPGTVTLTDLGSVFGPYSAAFNPATGAFTINSIRVMPGGSSYQFDAAHSLYLGSRRTRTLQPLENYAAPSARLSGGDANNDGLVDLSDLTCIGGSFGSSPVACGTSGSSDLNSDGAVNILDLVLAGGNYGLAAPRIW